MHIYCILFVFMNRVARGLACECSEVYYPTKERLKWGNPGHVTAPALWTDASFLE